MSHLASLMEISPWLASWGRENSPKGNGGAIMKEE